MQPAITAAFFPALPDGCFFGAAALSAAVLCAGRLASNLPFFLIRIPPIQKPQRRHTLFCVCIIHKPTAFCNGIPDRNGLWNSEISINIFGGYMRAAKSIAAVGADAHIGPLGSYEFAADFRNNSVFCRVDVGIDPYSRVSNCMRIRAEFTPLPSVRAVRRRRRRAASRALTGLRPF